MRKHADSTQTNGATRISCRRRHALTVALTLTFAGLVAANSEKLEETPSFWQRDPDAAFDNEGRNHCAPVAISDGLIYLTGSRNFEGLVDHPGHGGQIALIKELAEEMSTDPVAGTDPDKILTGLRSYAKKRGYSFARLELATWRSVSAANKSYKIGRKPSLRWLTAAAKDPDVVEVLNFGWYKQEEDGRYTRHSGHWVDVVNAGPSAGELEIRNPLLKPERQETDTSITLTQVADDFVVSSAAGEETNMSGYYLAEGPGLPFNQDRVTAAVLDSVIVFKLQKD